MDIEIKHIPKQQFKKKFIDKENELTYESKNGITAVTYHALSLTMVVVNILSIFYMLYLDLSGGEHTFLSSVTIFFIATATIFSSYMSLKQVSRCSTIFGTILNILFGLFVLFSGFYLLLLAFTVT